MTEHKYPSIYRAVFREPWAILPEVYATICEIVSFRAGGGILSDEEIQQRISAGQIRQGAGRSGAIAVLPLYGVISQRMDLMAATSGGTSTERFAEAFRNAVTDPGISAIVMDVDSPGGSIFGIEELWTTIMGARGKKPISAVANSTGASAAYWLMSAADEIVITPGGQVGSIGVLTAVEDDSAAREARGLSTTVISAGKFKAEGALGPLSDEAKANIQERVDVYYETFVRSVGRGRGVTSSDVKSGFGEGRMVSAAKAVELGMADRVGTLLGTLQRLAGGSGSSSSRASAEDLEEIVAETEGAIEAAAEERVEVITTEEPAPAPEAAETPSDLGYRYRRMKMGARGG